MFTPKPQRRARSSFLSKVPSEEHTSYELDAARRVAVDDDPSSPSICQYRAALPRLVTVPEAARLLGVGRTTAYQLVAAGQLEVVHIGRAARVPMDAIDEFVEVLRSGG